MVDNLVNKFFNDFLLDKIQPLLIASDDNVITRTCIQYLVEMVHLSTSPKIITNIFFFLFGFPEGLRPIEEEEKHEVEYEHIDQEEHKHEDIDDMFAFLKEDNTYVHQGDHDGTEFVQFDEDMDLDPIPHDEEPMIRIGGQMVPGPKQQPSPAYEPRGREKQTPNTGKRGRSVSILAVKDAKIELDLLSSILDSVENAEK